MKLFHWHKLEKKKYEKMVKETSTDTREGIISRGIKTSSRKMIKLLVHFFFISCDEQETFLD